MVETTAAVVRDAGGPFELETVELDDPRPDEVLVDVRAVGVCHTDLSVRAGDHPVPFPAVLGHEGSGVVAAVGDAVTRVEPGDNVVLSFDYDGDCRNCHEGRPSSCASFGELNFGCRRPDGTSPISLDGEEIGGRFFGQSSFASRAVVSERSAVPVGDDVPIELLGPLGCGIQTGAGGVMNSLAPAPRDSVVVFGAGSVGLSGVLGARLRGCREIVAVDLVASRLETAASLGATATVNAGEVDDPVAAVREVLGGGADYTLETTGATAVFPQAVETLRPGGTCGVIGAPPAGSEVGLDPNVLLDGRAIQGIAEGSSVPPEFIPELVDHHRRGNFPFDEFVTFYEFDEIEDAVADAEAGDVIKPVLRMP